MVQESATFDTDTDSVAKARSFVARHLGAMGCRRGVVDAARLLVSELATNAVGGPGELFTVLLRQEGRRVTVEVSGQDATALADVDATRHLDFVDAVADRWRIRDDVDGSCSVSFDLTV